MRFSGEGWCRTYPFKSLSVAGFGRLPISRSPIGPREKKVQALDDLPQKLLAEGKPAYIVEEPCMAELTNEFRPSRYNYLLSVLEDDFQTEYSQWQQSGILTYEIINLLQSCNAVFDFFSFRKKMPTIGSSGMPLSVRYSSI